jgi:hypothetical protein
LRATCSGRSVMWVTVAGTLGVAPVDYCSNVRERG